MVIDFFLGISIFVISYYSFLRINYLSTLTDWIFQISKFVYLIGHPTLTEDQIHDHIKIRFKSVFGSFAKVLFKTLLFLSILIALLIISDFVSTSFQQNEIASIDRYNWKKIWKLPLLTNYIFLLGTLVPLFILPFLPKSSKTKDSEYSSIDKFLHYVFIGNKNVAKLLFRTEQSLRKREINTIMNEKNVYISGLARAGTTILMQYLGQIEKFRSISYQNLPFLFLPKSGLKFAKSNEKGAKERFHKDGLEHSLTSYEALEESFWRNFNGSKYIADNSLKRYSLENEVYSDYCDFRKLIADGNIYLAKNNNHLLRAKSLVKKDEENGISSLTIIPFRNPVDHAKSLLKQHRLLVEEQNKDEFVRDYMDFLVHHEFGQGTKVQIFEEGVEPNSEYEKEDLQYWLEVWYSYYESVLNEFKNEKNFTFFSYEHFVENPKNSLQKIFEFLHMPTSLVAGIAFKSFSQNNTMDDYISLNKNVEWDKFIRLYNELLTISINKP